MLALLAAFDAVLRIRAQDEETVTSQLLAGLHLAVLSASLTKEFHIPIETLKVGALFK